MNSYADRRSSADEPFHGIAAKMPVAKRKATGSDFTPPDLARLAAERVAALVSGRKGPLRVLNPACGDGNLLCAINNGLPRDVRWRVTLSRHRKRRGVVRIATGTTGKPER